MHRSLSLLGLLGVAAAMPSLSAQAKPTEGGPGSSFLLTLSREVTALKKQATSRVTVYVAENGLDGLYLGDGLVAGPYIADLKPGEAATMRAESGSYRLIVTGADLRLVTFFKLRDWPVDPAPKVPRPCADDWRERHGDLVCLVGARTAQLALIQQEIGFGMRGMRRSDRPDEGGREARGEAEAPAVQRYLVGYSLSDAASPAGCSVLTLDGGLVGMLARRTSPSEERPADAGASSRAAPAFACVIDRRWLVQRAQRHATEEPTVSLVPGLGVRVVDLRERAQQAAVRRGREAAEDQLPVSGLHVLSVSIGSPAWQSGVRRRDVWVEMQGKPLTEEGQIAEALRTLPSGAPLVIRFRRDGGAQGQPLQEIKVVPR